MNCGVLGEKRASAIAGVQRAMEPSIVLVRARCLRVCLRRPEGRASLRQNSLKKSTARSGGPLKSGACAAPRVRGRRDVGVPRSAAGGLYPDGGPFLATDTVSPYPLTLQLPVHKVPTLLRADGEIQRQYNERTRQQWRIRSMTIPERKDATRSASPPIAPPSPPAKYDSDWHERIERAKSAHEEGRKARQGKPATFSVQQGLT